MSWCEGGGEQNYSQCKSASEFPTSKSANVFPDSKFNWIKLTISPAIQNRCQSVRFVRSCDNNCIWTVRVWVGACVRVCVCVCQIGTEIAWPNDLIGPALSVLQHNTQHAASTLCLNYYRLKSQIGRSTKTLASVVTVVSPDLFHRRAGGGTWGRFLRCFRSHLTRSLR